jgi:energy-coupling factor transport system permease protein
MEDFGLLKYLTTGQVLPTGSPIHRLDPRTRLLGFLGLLVVFVASSRVGPAALALGATVGLLVLARIPLGYALQGLWLLLPWLLVIALIQVAFSVGDAAGCPLLLSWGPLRLTFCTLRFALLTLIRFVGLVLLVGLLIWTSPIPGLVRGLEALAGPLDRLGLPAHELAMVGVIAVRFVPTMALELERLRKAQAARGADLGRGRAGFLQRVRRTLPLIVPLFVLALRRAERLAEAMEARAYSGGRGRGRYACLRLRPADWLALGLLALFVAIALGVQTYSAAGF